MKEAYEFFNKLRSGMVGGLYTGALAKVERYDPAGKADITILPDGDLVGDVPVSIMQGAGFFIRVPLKRGDIVAVLFSSRSIDGVMHGEEDDSDRNHDINDAIIVGGINIFKDPLPATDPDKLVITAKEGGASITMGTDGKIVINGPQGVTIHGKNNIGSW